MTTAFKKITATTLAILSILFTFCITSFAAETPGGADVYIGSEVTHYDDISEAFVKAITASKESKLVLLEDWVADENGSFGEGKYFPGGGIGILKRYDNAFTLDLNGNTIDRGLTKERKDGYVFYVYYSRYITITDTSNAKTGLITGGFNKGNGGAFKLEGAKIEVTNLTVKGNVATERGGAFRAKDITLEDETISTVLTLDNCTVTENRAKTGGAIYVETANRIKLFDTRITNNYAKADAGIHTEVCGLYKSFITLGGMIVIAGNIAENDGEGLMLDENFFTKVVIEYSSSRPLFDSSKIVILSKTDDKTLRITEDSNYTHIGCFTYENDDYEIVAKGSGSEKYLDIKKN